MVAPKKYGDALYEARRTRTTIAPLTEQDPALTVTDAYAIQSAFVRRILEEGGSIVGYKLGLTSKPMRDLLGVHEPDYGPVISTMVYDDGQAIDLSAFIQPRVEAEMVLVLDRPLEGPGVTTMHAARAIGGAVAALELVDSRIEDWRIKLVDTIADLASSAATILGTRVVPLDGWDPGLCGMVIGRNGQIEATGAGAAALGNPVSAVAWLANTLATFGVALEPGHFVLTGSLHAAFPVAPGDTVRADFDRLGTVRVRFE